MNPGHILRSADISKDGVYRYYLRRQWDDQRPMMAWIMLNPSTADALVDDPTIRRCMRFAEREGYGGIMVYNLYALRATNPQMLGQVDDPVGPDNDWWLTELFKKYSVKVVAAWGANAGDDRADHVMALAKQHRHKIYCLGTTKAGHPRHPLYVPGDQELIEYER